VDPDSLVSLAVLEGQHPISRVVFQEIHILGEQPATTTPTHLQVARVPD